jgi:small subunit ribosomal protein S9
MADDQQTPETPDEQPSAGGQAPETPDEQAPDTAGEQVGADEQAAAEAAERAVPSEEAAEIAGSAEDAALEAFEEAGGEAPAQAGEQFEPVAGHAAPSEQALEIAGVAEDAALEAAQDATGETAQDAGDAAAQVPGVGTGPAATAPEQTGESQHGPGGGAAATPAAGADADAGSSTTDADEEDDEEAAAPREKPAVPGAHLEVDIVPEGVDPLGRDRTPADPYAEVAEVYEQEVVEENGEVQAQEEVLEEVLSEPISTAAIDLAAGARYRATGKRKTAIARVTLRPGSGTYTVNGRTLEQHFPRSTLQRNIRQPLETVGYQERMDVIARLHGGGISAQAGALRHGVSRALLEADPNLRGELKRRGFLTRDSRAKERKKAGLKKARKRPQFSKR